MRTFNLMCVLLCVLVLTGIVLKSLYIVFDNTKSGKVRKTEFGVAMYGCCVLLADLLLWRVMS